MLWVLDSTVLIDHLRGRPAVERVRNLSRSGEVAATTAINVEEVARGLRLQEVGKAQRLFRGLVVLPVGEDVAWQAGNWRRDFAARGVTLYKADCLVAATALLEHARLATGNPQDFPMPGLQVEHWPVCT